MPANLYEHRPTVATVEPVTDENLSDSEPAKIGDLKVTDEQGNVSYMSVEDFERNYTPKSAVKELGYMKVVSPKGTGHYPGSKVKILYGISPADLEGQINHYFGEGFNALVVEQHYFSTPGLICAAFTLNTVKSDDEVQEATEIQKEAERLTLERKKERAEVNRTAIEIAKKLTAERRAEEERKRKELEEEAEKGRYCKNNHGKGKK